MYIEAELIIKSYYPKKLKIGMYFYRVITVGVPLPIHEIWKLEELPEDIDEFLSQNGAPIELYIISEEEEEFMLLALHNEIGWFDAGDDTDELYDITLKEINTIIQEYDGFLEIEIEDDLEEDILPVYIQNKVIIKYPNDL